MTTPRLPLLLLALPLAALAKPGVPSPACGLRFYGTYSLGTRYDRSLRERARELHELGGNFVVATGESTRLLDDLPPGMQAAPGCTLMQPRDWKDASGAWSEETASRRLPLLAARLDHDPRVWGICLSHEVEEFADHERRVWMYRLAKRYFSKPVFFYYAGPAPDYGARGQVESDVLFVALPPYDAHGAYDVHKVDDWLDRTLALADRTPGIPVWLQTSINADQRYVHGPETMTRTWGADGERMLSHVATVTSRRSPHGTRVSGFFWRSLGRFEWDLGYPPFAAERARVREIARRWACTG